MIKYHVVFVNNAGHHVAGSQTQHTKIMSQYLKGVFNWDLDQVQEIPRSEFCPPPTPLGDLPSGNQDDQGQFVRAKKCELEGFIRKKISSLKIEEVIEDTNESLSANKLVIFRRPSKTKKIKTWKLVNFW